MGYKLNGVVLVEDFSLSSETVSGFGVLAVVDMQRIVDEVMKR